MKKSVPVLLGLIPLICGWIINYLLLTPLGSLGPLWLSVSIVLLFLWGFLGYKTKKYDRKPFSRTVKLNAVSLIMLLLVFVQELILGQYWPNLLGYSSQFNFLPCMTLAMWLESFVLDTLYPWLDCLVAFLLMFAASWIGCSLAKNKRRR